MPNQVPSRIWGDRIEDRHTEDFMREAGLNYAPPTQRFLCAFCAAESNEKPPEMIIMINGTTVCVNHRINLVN